MVQRERRSRDQTQTETAYSFSNELNCSFMLSVLIGWLKTLSLDARCHFSRK